MGLTFAGRWKPENTLLLQRWALPGPCYIKEQDHPIQGDFAELCIPALCYRGGVQKRPSAAALRLSGVTSLALSTGTSQEASVMPGSGGPEPGSGRRGDMWEADTWVERVPYTMQVSGTQCRLTESDPKAWFSRGPLEASEVQLAWGRAKILSLRGTYPPCITCSSSPPGFRETTHTPLPAGFTLSPWA